MKASLLVLAAIGVAITTAAAAQTTPQTVDRRDAAHDAESPAQRSQRLAYDRAHSKAHDAESPAQRSQRLAYDRAHSKAHADETAVQRSKRLAADRAHSLAAERNEAPNAADAAADKQRLAADKARAMTKKNRT